MHYGTCAHARVCVYVCYSKIQRVSVPASSQAACVCGDAIICCCVPDPRLYLHVALVGRCRECTVQQCSTCQVLGHIANTSKEERGQKDPQELHTEPRLSLVAVCHTRAAPRW